MKLKKVIWKRRTAADDCETYTFVGPDLTCMWCVETKKSASKVLLDALADLTPSSYTWEDGNAEANFRGALVRCRTRLMNGDLGAFQDLVQSLKETVAEAELEYLWRYDFGEWVFEPEETYDDKPKLEAHVRLFSRELYFTGMKGGTPQWSAELKRASIIPLGELDVVLACIKDSGYRSEVGIRGFATLADPEPQGLEIPPGLCPLGQAAAEAVVQLLKERDSSYTGGCRVFYTPAEWAERQEEYGTSSLLIVVHDGGDHASFFSWDYERHAHIEAVDDRLEPLGLYAEQCTGWYSAIYKI